MSATPKQVRNHYKKIRYHMYRLQTALHNAHNADVIKYGDSVDSPCSALYKCRELVDKTTKDARAEALKDECMNELKGIW